MNERSFIFASMRIRDEKKQALIRKKAIEMIVKEGFDGLSMQKLAKAARVSPATIYIYFKNREDLLNQVFNEVQQTFSAIALEGFDPESSLREGLWIQWKNRFHFIVKYPTYYRFYEQFRNSPLLQQQRVKMMEFKEKMKQFVFNAMKRNEIKKMEPELFWAIAYGAFYTLIKFHLDKKSLMDREFILTEAKLKQTFEMVIQAFKS